ncbi:hypothetical protein [Streptomyces pratensis]|nr:hypothetical protein [Streptomyces pratensis]
MTPTAGVHAAGVPARFAGRKHLSEAEWDRSMAAWRAAHPDAPGDLGRP